MSWCWLKTSARMNLYLFKFMVLNTIHILCSYQNNAEHCSSYYMLHLSLDKLCSEDTDIYSEKCAAISFQCLCMATLGAMLGHGILSMIVHDHSRCHARPWHAGSILSMIVHDQSRWHAGSWHAGRILSKLVHGHAWPAMDQYSSNDTPLVAILGHGMQAAFYQW